MDEAKKRELVQLVSDMESKKLRYEMLSMTNRPLDPEEAKQLRIELEIARAEYAEASQKLIMAQPPIPEIPEFQLGVLKELLGMTPSE